MSDTPSERAEAAATRRRWITLAEVVAVAGVLIGALTLYTNWSDRRADEEGDRGADRLLRQHAGAAHRPLGKSELP